MKPGDLTVAKSASARFLKTFDHDEIDIQTSMQIEPLRVDAAEDGRRPFTGSPASMVWTAIKLDPPEGSLIRSKFLWGSSNILYVVAYLGAMILFLIPPITDIFGHEEKFLIVNIAALLVGPVASWILAGILRGLALKSRSGHGAEPR